MANITGFKPIANRQSTILILGSIPGAKSLVKNEYYAFKRNCFWKIMTELLQAHDCQSYQQRIKLLRDHGVALWDVLQSCARKGSLDSSIVSTSVNINNFTQFFRSHPNINTICFNGKKAEALFRSHVLENHPGLRSKSFISLPSTSPAMAVLSQAQKKREWSVLMQYMN